MFLGKYAELYDLFHANKNYKKDVLQIIKAIGFRETEGLLGFDFGCGTGVHAFEFEKLGVRVEGYDISEDMLATAQKKYPNLKFSQNLEDFNKQYDFTYSLFDVISYQVSREAALNLITELFLRTKSGSYCLVDSWNARGVLLDPPKTNERMVTTSFGDIIRRVIPDSNRSSENLYELSIQLLKHNSQKPFRTETHVLRAWSPEQVKEMMSSVGFEELVVFNPIDLDLQFEEDDWRFGVRARKP